MKQLYLVRHAQAEFMQADNTDYNRMLTAQGEQEAHWIGNQLVTQNTFIDELLTSPAQRALSTAKLLAAELNFPFDKIRTDSSLYNANPEQLITIIHSAPEDSASLMLIAHNPGLSLLAQLLTNDKVNNLPTCAVCHLEIPITNWEELNLQSPAQLRNFIYPEDS